MPLLMRHPIGLLLAVTAVTLVGEAVRPSQAVAGCGDYVVYTNPSDAHRHHSEMPADDPKPGRCDGPTCRQAPPPSAPSNVPTPTRSVSDDRLNAEPATTTPDSLSRTFAADAPAGRPVRRGTDVFHPPR